MALAKHAPHYRVPEHRLTSFGHWLRFHKRNYVEAGRALRCTPQYVQMLATGRAVPKLATAYRIERWTLRETPDDPVMMQTWALMMQPRDTAIY